MMKIAKLAALILAAVLADSTAVSSLDMPMPKSAGVSEPARPLMLLMSRDGQAVGGVALVSR